MRIRPAVTGDHRALSAIDTIAVSEPKRRDEIASWIDQGQCHLVEIDGVVAAYGVFTRHFFGHAFIEMLMVGPDHRRRGLGAALIAYFQAMAAREKLFSSTNLSNRAMQALFVKSGFKLSGAIDNLDENDPEVVFYCAPRPGKA
ncbi:GNAT family N-acetyltransferase [Ensifer sp. NPDC090286]|uniref:GNAT family N-acetyltransferase n=1 Tax=Ensifer sp. NPDC090286 TaxID=3363991 RepID=UPI00383B6922